MAIVMRDVVQALEKLGAGELAALQVIDAAELAKQYYPLFDPSGATLVVNTEGADMHRVRAVLLQAYPGTHIVSLLRKEAEQAALAQLEGGTGATALFVPPLPYPGSYSALQNVAARLRAPDGCPWDRELTWAKLRPFLLEETHELLAALDVEDPRKVMEEEGDLLLQIALQAQIATEHGQYRFPEVARAIVEKLIRRHPHVFGEVAVSGTDEVLANWEAIKAAERAKSGEKKSPLAGVPKGLPALAQAEAYLDRMSRLRSATPPMEPWAPLANLGQDEPLTSETLGQTLFDLVAWAMARGVEAESSLREANARFAADVDLSP
jgi:tetrapyrrole methylase family protein/MazG family protein